MHVGIEPPRQVHVLAKLLAAEALEPFLAEHQARLDELRVRALAEGVRDDGFVLLGRDAAGRVDDEPARRGRGRDGVDRAEDELLLEVREQGEVALGLRGEKVSVGSDGRREGRDRPC